MALVNIHYDTMTVTHIKQTPAMEVSTVVLQTLLRKKMKHGVQLMVNSWRFSE